MKTEDDDCGQIGDLPRRRVGDSGRVRAVSLGGRWLSNGLKPIASQPRYFGIGSSSPRERREIRKERSFQDDKAKDDKTGV
jgi:hypothetical protein